MVELEHARALLEQMGLDTAAQLLSLSKKSHNAPFSCIIEEKGAKSWNSGEKMPGRSQ